MKKRLLYGMGSLVLLFSVFYLFTQNKVDPKRHFMLQDSASHCSSYYKLKSEIGRYENIQEAGGWPGISKNILLEKNAKSYSLLLRKRLLISGDIRTGSDSTDLSLKQGLKYFQKRHGIDTTGKVDKITLEALNVPVEKRLSQLKINLQRWEKLPDNLGDIYIFVNTADFKLEVVENGVSQLKMKVIVGRPYRKTPVFQAKLTYMVFNPSWVIPYSIYQRDILPEIWKDSSYLRKNHIRVFDLSVKNEKREANPDTISWEDVPEKNFQYELVQEPGPNNAMGVVKFMFPNEYRVYMHDTPAKQLFEETEPTYSSGCIRISDAISLAAFLLKSKTGWDREKIMNTISSGKTLTVPLEYPVDVYIQYFTAWVDETGVLQFRKDIYKRDALVSPIK